jgi:hypothetical protein
MLFKKVYLVIMAGVFSFSMLSCGSSSKTGPTQEVADTIVIGAMNAVYAAYGDIPAKKDAIKSSSSGSASGTGWTATYDYTYTGVNDYSYDIVFTWDGFTHGDVTLSSGTVEFVITVLSSTSLTYDYTGDFNVIYQGVAHAFSWDINYVYDSPDYSYSGSFTIDGTTYSYTY